MKLDDANSRVPTAALHTDHILQFIVMFRARFTETLPKSLPNFGPQELERDIVDSVPGTRVEQFLCALLGLLLNRKQDVKYACNLSPRDASRAVADLVFFI